MRATREAVLAWLDATGATAGEAVDHFLPGASPKDRTRLHNQIRQWRHRARRESDAPPEPGAAVAAPPPPASTWAPDPSAAEGTHVEFLASLVANAAGDIAWLRANGRIDAALKYTATLAELRKDLEAARRAAAGRVTLERTPAQIAIEIERRRVLLDLQAEKERRRLAREGRDL